MLNITLNFENDIENDFLFLFYKRPLKGTKGLKSNFFTSIYLGLESWDEMIPLLGFIVTI